MPPTGDLDELRELAERRHQQPQDVLLRAKELLEQGPDTEIVARAHWVIGLALHELGRPADAVVAYRRAVEVSVGHKLLDTEALARAGLAVSLLSTGDSAGAEAQMATAQAVSPPATRGVVAMLRGLMLQRTGRLDDALVAYRRALRLLEKAGDQASMARLRLNRGTLLAYQGEPQRALDDLEAAEALARACHLPVLAAMAAHNTGFAHGRRGHLPDALAAFARAEQAYAELQHPGLLAAVLQADRCEVLLLAGLASEARRAARGAVEAVGQSGDLAYLAECRLLLARALVASGDYQEAAEMAERAARDFRRGRRAPWAALAHYVGVQAEVLASQDQARIPRGLLARCRRYATELESQGWPVEAVHVRTFAGRVALASRQPGLARAELARALPARQRGPAEGRAQAWQAAALLAVAEGDRGKARRALARGMTVVAEHLATLGATELRARAGSLGGELARLGIRLALEDGRPSEVLRWAETGRAASLRRPAMHPPDDEQLAADLTELRRLRSELREAALTAEPPRHLERRAVAIEAAVRRRGLELRDDSAATTRPDISQIRGALGDRVLVEYVDFEGTLYAVTMTTTRSQLHRLGRSGEIEQEKHYLLFALRRRLKSGSPPATDYVLASTASRLDHLLVEPLGLSGAAALVVVPTGILHGLPWFALPNLAGRTVNIAPSAALWAERQKPPAGTPPPGRQRVTLIAGPGLPAAEREVLQLSRLYPRGRVLSGASATASNVVAAMSASGLIHLAAHGNFRADSPLFSSILLADGPMTVHDLGRVRPAPHTVVLASCDAAVNSVEAGDEVLGTAAALIALGVRWVVAPVTPVPDDVTADFMVEFHRALVGGCRPPQALAEARATDGLGVGSVFVCIGRDDHWEPGRRSERGRRLVRG